MEVKAPAVELPKVELPAVEAPQVEVKAPAVELPQAEAELPKAEVEWPKISGTVAAAGAALAAAGPEAPHLEAEVAHIGAELPEVEPEGQRVLVHFPVAQDVLPEAAVEVTGPGAPAVQADDLGQISGIGPKYAAQLSAAGITTFAALAAAKPERLAEIIQAPSWRKVDHAAWIAEAGVLASQPRRQAVGDELEIIEGIGPVYAGKLRAAGITTFGQLAQTGEARLAEIVQAPAWRRVNYGDWIAQAKLAAAGDDAGLKALQDKLFAREGDNLGLVSGVGEKTADALRASGITSFAALAAASPEQLGEITKRAGVRGGDFQAWIGEAKFRAAGKRVQRAPEPSGARLVPAGPFAGEGHRERLRRQALRRRHRHLLATRQRR